MTKSKFLHNVQSDLCISCGMCESLSDGKISLAYNGKGMYKPLAVSVKNLSEDLVERIEQICPGSGYPIMQISKKLFPGAKYDYKIGYYHSYYAVRSCSDTILKKASSGGMMTSLAFYLLTHKIVDGVIATKFSYENNDVIPVPIIATSIQELLECQGSKYMPVPIFKILDKVKFFNGTLAMIGTPCQIAALRNLQSIQPEYNKIRYTIGNFCGGYRDLRELDRFKEIAGLRNEKITYFQYRGDGQPGQMLIKSHSKSWSYPYPKYAKLTGNIKCYRCRVCIDATAELADISCGDAWIDRYVNRQNTRGGWSMVIIRNPELLDIFHKMKNESLIEYEQISIEDLLKSQKQNILSKKERYESRAKFLKIIGKSLPLFDGGYNTKCTTSLFFEAKVYFSQLYKLFLERIGLYPLIIKNKANDR